MKNTLEKSVNLIQECIRINNIDEDTAFNALCHLMDSRIPTLNKEELEAFFKSTKFLYDSQIRYLEKVQK